MFKYILDKEFLSYELKSQGYGYVPREPWEAGMRLKGFCCEDGIAYFTVAICITAERQQHAKCSMAKDGVLESEVATVSLKDAITHFKRFEEGASRPAAQPRAKLVSQPASQPASL